MSARVKGALAAVVFCVAVAFMVFGQVLAWARDPMCAAMLIYSLVGLVGAASIWKGADQ